MVKRYRSRQVEIDAVQLHSGNYLGVQDWIRHNGGECHVTPGGGLLIHTLEGNMIARPTDYVIRGLLGEFYPCKAEVFERKYDDLMNTQATFEEFLKNRLGENYTSIVIEALDAYDEVKAEKPAGV